MTWRGGVANARILAFKTGLAIFYFIQYTAVATGQ